MSHRKSIHTEIIGLRAWGRRVVAFAMLGLVIALHSTNAQTSSPARATPELESRAQLEAEAKKAEAGNRKGEAWLLRQRLANGDFQEGDRIVIKLLSPAAMMGIVLQGMDTVTVRAGKVITLPQMDDLSLDGVLRSELTPRLSSHLAKYLKDSSVKAMPLVRLYVGGQVGRPMYIFTTLDVLISDVMMKAGGPLPSADLANVVVRRGGEIIWSAADVRTALSEGLSLERLHLQTGDEIFVDDIKKSFNWQNVAAYIGPILGLFYTFNRIFR